MAGLTIVTTEVHVVLQGVQHTAPCSVAVTAGQMVRQDPTTGQWVLANSDTLAHLGEPYIAGHGAGVGMPLTAYKEGTVLDLGSALDALNFDAKIYPNDTDGLLGTAPGTIEKVIGRVVAGFAATAGSKLLRLVASPVMDDVS